MSNFQLFPGNNNKNDMNKKYLKWLRQLQNEPMFLMSGGGKTEISFHRKYFLAGWEPSDSAFMCIPW